MTSSTNTSKTTNDPWTDLNCDDAELQNLLDKPLEGINNSSLRDNEQHMGFDSNLGDTWIYPSNLPCRSYQMSIVQAALYRNTLVVLPTGLGKTFIAAVVMYNIYRWYPRGKVIFMAPTRPLVNQQIEACQKIMPFPRKATVELTGKIPKAKRSELWESKRVFFATPQVVQSDILGAKGPLGDEEVPFDNVASMSKTDFPFDAIKLIVIDEAHKAKGKYAYTEVAQALAAKVKYFRILALSATPGRTMEDVAEVCRNLMISHIEVRWDSSIDVLPYVHKRHLETVVVSLGNNIKEIREKLLEIIDPYLRQLIECNVLSGSLANINRNFLVFAQKHYQDRSAQNGRHPQHSAIITNFGLCISLYHAAELLERHGTRVFLNYFEDDVDGKAKFVIQMERRLRELVEDVKQEVGPNPFDVSAGPMTNGEIAEMPKDLDFGHPKFEKARECLLKHFESNKDSRAIVFCEYRESVLLMYRMLLQHKPILRPRCFVGQGGTGTLRALTQKQQIQIMNDFRSGKSNILIATSIGEEGIDVGEVELIVCFDISTSNPTRFVQRIGRTGRNKNGHVFMLVTEGREQQILRDVLNNKDQINKKLLRSTVVQQSLYKHSPRLVPTDLKPQCVQTFITPDENDKDESEGVKSKKPVLSKKAEKAQTAGKGCHDLRKFFNKKPSTEMDAEDLKYFEINTKMTQAKPGMLTQQKMEKSFDQMKNLFKDLQSPVPTQVNQKPKEEKNNGNISATIELSDDSPEKTPIRRKLLTASQGSIKEFFKDDNTSQNACRSSPVRKSKEDNPLHRLQSVFEKEITTGDVVKRAKINDLKHHLKSHEMSRDMKFVLLAGRPQYIKDNLEQMNVLQAVHDMDNSQETEEEKSIKEIHSIILEIFGGLANVERFLQDTDLNLVCLINDLSSEEESESEDNRQFSKALDNIFQDFGEPLESDKTYEWMQQRLQSSNRYKAKERAKITARVQESMVYTTLVAGDDYDDASFNTCDENSVLESKYCSQWQEFNKPDLAFKSTPLHGGSIKKTLNSKGNGLTKRSSLLTKLEEAKEEDEDCDLQSNDNDNKAETSNKFLESLKLCEKSLNTMLEQQKETEREAKQSMSYDVLEDAMSTSTDSNLTTGSLQPFGTEPDFISARLNEKSNAKVNNLRKSELPQLTEDTTEEDELFQAVMEAELKLTQTKTEEHADNSASNRYAKDNSETSDKLNVTSDKSFNSFKNKTVISLDSTPEHIDFPNNREETHELSAASGEPTKKSIQEELDVDMAAFMEPFPEEQELLKISINSRRESFKENFAKDFYTRESPDLFAEEHMPSVKHVKPLPYKSSLASKLSNKLSVPRCQSALNPSISEHSSLSFKSPRDLLKPTKSCADLTSPTSRLSTDNLKTDKSPSVFDMYLKNAKGRVKLPKTLANTSSNLGISRTSNDRDAKVSPIISCSQNDSPLVVRKRAAAASKRKIFDSDTEETDESHNEQTVVEINRGNNEEDEDSDFEEVAATQAPDDSSIYHRRKRRRFNSFIQDEAALSGDSADASEDENEHSFGGYLLDSVVVQSDDNDEDQASTSHMQGMYLQSLKSPRHHRRGGFKIPAHRIYNDRSQIFSQALLPEEVCSQYVPDSFVVEEDDSFITNNENVTDVSMCPLERAEKILKERRRAKKREIKAQASSTKAPATKRLRQIVIHDSSDEDFD